MEATRESGVLPAPLNGDGGCDFRYRASECAWGREPEEIMPVVRNLLPLPGATVLDAGCGEGRNAAYLAASGSVVDALDMSAEALGHARAAWPEAQIRWQQADITTVPLPTAAYDGVLMCSLLHWLRDETGVIDVLERLRGVVKPGGLHAIVVFNDRLRYPESSAPRMPVQLSHQWYLSRYHDWELLFESDEDATHTHPGEQLAHAHSITRIVARHPGQASEQQ